MAFVDAGHNYSALQKDDGKYTIEKDKHSIVLVALKTAKFQLNEIDLKPNDTVFLYTDGVTEANNKEYELFGTERMVDALNSNPSGPVSLVLQNIRLAVDRFAGAEPQFDDTTMLLFEYKGPQGEAAQET
jgi:sigma-B regulation protein RsbU (phosphoserine phosphatase)